MSDPAQDTEVLLEAARLNREDPLLHGSLLRFPNYGQLVMTGDLHGNWRNFEKLRKYCDLKHAGARHVILHELIHEEVATIDGVDDSYRLQIEAARWKCEYPDQIHFLQSNHELAQVLGMEISKNGRVATAEFERAVRKAYGDQSDKVLEAIHTFILSCPLAGRTPNRVFLSHSLPSPHTMPSFDPAVFTRVPTDEDLQSPGSGYLLVWGRHQTAEELDQLTEMLDADFFLCGHQPQEMGHEVLHDRLIILASEHNHGVFLPFDLAKPITLEKLTRNIRPFAGIE